MSDKIPPEAALKVLEVFTNRVGVKLETDDRFTTLNDMVMGVNVAFLRLVDAAENSPGDVADKLVDLSAVCVIAVASMVAGTDAVASTRTTRAAVEGEGENQTVIGRAAPEEKLTPDEQRAFDLMQERMAKLRKQAGIVL